MLMEEIALSARINPVSPAVITAPIHLLAAPAESLPEPSVSPIESDGKPFDEETNVYYLRHWGINE